MKITWLGQAGLLFETDGKKIVIDPYLSDNVKNFEPQNYRRVPVDEAFLQIKPDVLMNLFDVSERRLENALKRIFMTMHKEKEL